jgi:endoglucanase
VDFVEQMLKEMTDAHGTSGHEGSARSVMRRYLKNNARISYDRLGSLIAEKKGRAGGPRVMIAAHLDEVGFMVSEIDKNGYIRFLPLGGWWGHVVLGQRVKIHTAKGPVVAVVGCTPPHMLPEEKRKNVLPLEKMYLDVGCQKGFDVKKKLGIRKGDFITPVSDFAVMGNKKMYLAKAFDNRVCCALVCDLFRSLAKKSHPNTLVGVGTVQEEVGLRGAQTSAHGVNPDLALVLDIGIAQDTPGFEGEQEEKLGSGPAVLVYDAGMIPNERLLKLVIATAEKAKIPFCLTSILRGSTDGARISQSRTGVPTVTFGPPVRYIHSHNGILNRADYDNTLKLLQLVVQKLDAAFLKSLQTAD